MKVNIKLIRIIIIIFIVIDLLLFSFLTISKNITSDKFINESVSNYNFKDYLLNYEIIKTSIKNSKYPKEIFYYIDDVELNKIKKNLIKNLINKEKSLINEDRINNLLINSVYEYENRNIVSVIDNVRIDIEQFSKEFSNYYNSDLINSYTFLYNISNSIVYLISIIILIILMTILIFLEKGIFYSGIILLVYSIIIYYINYYLNDIIYNDIFKYINNLELKLNNIFIICFILGFVLLLIYMIKLIRVFLRNQRIKDYINR